MRAEVAVVGAGPGGLAAALAAADAGCQVALIDNAPRVGGQIYRHSQRLDGHSQRLDGHSQLPDRLRRAAAHPRITLATGTSVWHAQPAGTGFQLHCTGDIEAVEAAALVLATGAAELVMPFPGWTLPGVVTAGAAQALLKAHGTLAGRRILVAGTGPLLLPVAAGLTASGAQVAALCQTTSIGPALASLPALIRHPGKLAEAAGYAAALARGRVHTLAGWALTACHGDGRVEEAQVTPVGRDWQARGPARSIAVDAVAVSHGLVPLLDLSRALGCRDEQVEGYPAATVAVDAGQATSTPGVFACGELTGVGGAVKAEVEGTVAGASAARHLGRLDDAGFRARTAGAARRIASARHFAALLGQLFPVADGWLERLQPDTVICRCEDVTWSELAGALSAGARDVRAVKGLTRCGMGYCQGRVCGPVAAQATAKLTGQPLAAVGDLHTRHVVIPVPLSRIAAAGGPVSEPPEAGSSQSAAPT
jgi:D-hydroxyproline dehydrogenase subunit alpha